ncbi:hypothetical protein ACVFVO_14610 [Advenella kashmirensis]
MDSSPTVLEKGIELLERPWTAQWALQMTCLILFVDIAMILHFNKGISQWSEISPPPQSDIGWIALTIVAFSLFAGIIIPALSILLSQIIHQIIIWMPNFFSSSDYSYQRHSGNVPVGAFRDLALLEKNEFLYRLYEIHQQKQSYWRKSRKQLGNYTITVAIAALADWLTFSGNDSVSLINALIQLFGSSAGLFISVIILSILSMLKWAWFPPYTPEEIYYPPLDQELRKEEQKRTHQNENILY